MADKVVLDLNDLVSGRIEIASFKSLVDQMDLSPYVGKHVQIKGCAPTWAHLLVAGKLFDQVAGLDFLVDDGKGGVAVEVYRKG